MAQVTPFKSPVGDLKWVVFNGEGKENMSGKMKYTADLVLPADDEKALALKASLDAYWEENKPAGLPPKKPAKSMGYRMEKEPILDAEGNKQYDDEGKVLSRETGNIVFTFQTDTVYPSGDPKVVAIFNAKGNKVDLGQKKIGNGSQGQISGAMGLYVIKTKDKVTDAGVTLYLNSIRLTKFVAFEAGDSWDAIDDEDGWTGEGETDGWEGEAGQEAKGTPRL